MFLAQAVVPHPLIHCTSMLPSNGQLLMTKYLCSFVPHVESKVMYGLLVYLCLDGWFFICFCMSRHLIFGVMLEGSCTYVYLI